MRRIEKHSRAETQGCGEGKGVKGDFRIRWMHHPYFGIQALDAWDLEHVRSISGFQAMLGFKYVVF